MTYDRYYLANVPGHVTNRGHNTTTQHTDTRPNQTIPADSKLGGAPTWGSTGELRGVGGGRTFLLEKRTVLTFTDLNTVPYHKCIALPIVIQFQFFCDISGAFINLLILRVRPLYVSNLRRLKSFVVKQSVIRHISWSSFVIIICFRAALGLPY